MTLRIECVDIDCHDAEALARFWMDALGYEEAWRDKGEIAIRAKDGSGSELLFLEVPDDKVVKNRLHLDLRPDDQAAEVARLESLGATRVDIGQQPDVKWVVLADPEGNEFCVLRSSS